MNMCPKCGGNDLRVQLQAVFAWDGKAPAVGPEDLRSDEFPIADEAMVLCNSCGAVATVHELQHEEG